MQIIKHGDPAVTMRARVFRCPTCGCEFRADRCEYKTVILRSEQFSIADCPECGNCADAIGEDSKSASAVIADVVAAGFVHAARDAHGRLHVF